MQRFLKTVAVMALSNTRGRSALIAPLASMLILALWAVPVRAETFSFTALLNSGQEPPPNTNNSNALGVAFVTFNIATGELCFSITFEDEKLTSRETAAHFHFPAPPGANAPAQIFLVPGDFPGSPKNGCLTPELTAEDKRDLFRGLWYVNIHTEVNPGGEIRGQVLPQMAPIF